MSDDKVWGSFTVEKRLALLEVYEKCKRIQMMALALVSPTPATKGDVRRAKELADYYGWEQT